MPNKLSGLLPWGARTSCSLNPTKALKPVPSFTAWQKQPKQTTLIPTNTSSYFLQKCPSIWKIKKTEFSRGSSPLVRPGTERMSQSLQKIVKIFQKYKTPTTSWNPAEMQGFFYPWYSCLRTYHYPVFYGMSVVFIHVFLLSKELFDHFYAI